MKTSRILLALWLVGFLGGQAASAIEVGTAAPAGSGVNESGNTVHFADYYGKGPVLVYFYPRADTPGCTAEACGLRDSFDTLKGRGLQIVGVSEDGVDAQKKFQEKYHLPFVLVADADGKIAKAFGVPTFLGFAKRQSFLVKDGKVVWRDLSVSPKTHATEVAQALDALK